MRNIIVVLFGVLILSSCQQDGALEEANSTNEAEPKAAQSTQNTQKGAVVECPTAGTYKYVDAFNPSSEVAQPTAVQGTIEGTGEIVIGEQKCTLDVKISDTATENTLPPLVAIGTEKDLRVTTLENFGSCSFEVFGALGGIRAVAIARSTDHSPKPQSMPEGLNVSLNAPPPGSSAVTLENYIYFLGFNGWIGRIKPQMVGGGCVEYITSNPDAANISTDGATLTVGTSKNDPIKINL